MMRKTLVALAVIVLVVVVAGVFYLDTLVKNRIERIGTRVAGVPVTLASAEVNLLEGRILLTGLEVSNPEGFSSQPAMRFGEIEVDADILKGEVQRITTADPGILIEGAIGRTNLDKLRGNFPTEQRDSPRGKKDRAGSDRKASKPKASQSAGQGERDRPEDSDAREEKPEPKDSAKYTIHKIEVLRANARIDIEEVGQPVDLELDAIEFNNLHGTRSQITEQMLDQLTARVLDAAEERFMEVAKEALKAEFEQEKKKLKRKARKKLLQLLE